MLRAAMRALGLAIYTLAAAATIVDARADGGKGLPEGFPFLAQLRETWDRLGFPGSHPASVASRDIAGLPRAPLPGPDRRLGTGDRKALPSNLADEHATELRPSLPPGTTGIRVNRGLP